MKKNFVKTYVEQNKGWATIRYCCSTFIFSSVSVRANKLLVSFPLKFQADFVYYIFITERIKVFVGIVHAVANVGCIENIQGTKRGYVQAFG